MHEEGERACGCMCSRMLFSTRCFTSFILTEEAIKGRSCCWWSRGWGRSKEDCAGHTKQHWPSTYVLICAVPGTRGGQPTRHHESYICGPLDLFPHLCVLLSLIVSYTR